MCAPTRSAPKSSRSMLHPLTDSHLSLSLRARVLHTQTLAYMLDSLVRVSRRVEWNHFVNIPNAQDRSAYAAAIEHAPCKQTYTLTAIGSTNYLAEACVLFPQSTATYAIEGYNRRPREADLSSLHLSPLPANWCWLAHGQSTRALNSRPSTPRRTPLCVQHLLPSAHWIAHKPSLAPYGSLGTASSTFHLLFKVLFTFRSHYFFAIGLPGIFSFRWDLPPI